MAMRESVIKCIVGLGAMWAGFTMVLFNVFNAPIFLVSSVILSINSILLHVEQVGLLQEVLSDSF